ncbi:MAG: hypothetical protein IJN49_04670 [Clostridia bacterium]|nr:hypothetical protein [Clostridia bacterium]
MDSIKTVLINYAVCALLGSIFEFIAPRRNKETFRIISSIILISVIVIPLATFDFKGAVDNMEIQVETEKTEEQALLNTSKLIEREIYKKVEEILINEGVNEYEIYISTEISEESKEIILKELKVLIDSNFKEKITVLEGKLQGDFGEVLKIGVKEND